MDGQRRVSKPALPLDDVSSNQGQSPVRYRPILGKQAQLAGLETVAPKGASGALNSGATVTNGRRRHAERRTVFSSPRRT
jgi:hypothetical protein